MGTALAEKLETAGVKQNETQFYMALSRFLNTGGTVERAHALIDEVAKRMGGDDHCRGAAKANVQSGIAPQPKGNGAGHTAIVRPTTLQEPRSVSPIYLAAARKGAGQIAATVLDSFKVRDGRSIGDLPWSGLDRIIGLNAREAAVLRMVRENIGGVPADPNAPVRDLISAADLERIIQKAAELQDAH